MFTSMALRSSLKSTSIILREGGVLSRLKGICSALPLKHGTEQHGRIGTGSFAIQPVRSYAARGGVSIKTKNTEPTIVSQLSDLAPTMLKKEYQNVPIAQTTTDEVVKKLLTLELASQREKMALKTHQMILKVRRDESDTKSPEVRIAILTARIRNFQEHMQKHRKDKKQKRLMLMSIDKRSKLLKVLRRTNYYAFEHVCNELGITYAFPPEYYRRQTRRYLAKKELCKKVFEEVQRLKMVQKKRKVELEEKRKALDAEIRAALRAKRAAMQASSSPSDSVQPAAPGS